MCLSIARIVHKTDSVNLMYMRTHLTYYVNGSEFTAIYSPMDKKASIALTVQVDYLKQTALYTVKIKFCCYRPTVP